jgi:hypothetical protein
MCFEFSIAQPAFPRASDSEDGNLIEFDAIRIRQAKGPDLFEVFGKSPGATRQLRLRYHEEQYPARHEPPAGLSQKHRLHSEVRGLSDLKVIGWIQIEKCKAVDAALNFEGIALHYFDSALPGPLCSIGIEFDAVPQGRALLYQKIECSAVTDAWIQGGKRFLGEYEVISKAECLDTRQWVISEFETACVSHVISFISEAGEDDVT